MPRNVGSARGARLTAIACGALLAAQPVLAAPVLSLAPDRGFSEEGPAASSTGADGFSSGRGSTSHLGAFQIVINAGAGLAGNSPALAAFQRAAAQWESRISDPVTINIDANLAALGSGVLGSTSSVDLLGDYPTMRVAMILDALDEPDDGVVTALPPSMTFTMPAGFSQAVDSGTPLIQVTKANAKALGFGGLDDAFGVSDGAITFSNTFPFDFDNSNGVSSGTYNFETVAAHEIGHLLGFISDVDYIDFRMSKGQTGSDVTPTTLDMFRFDNDGPNDPATDLQFSFYPRSMVPGNDEVTDQIDAVFGAVEGRMATGTTQGDGRQASHWKDGLGIGIMGPTLGSGQISPITLTDFRAMDLIGYDIVVVPEAAAWTFGAVATCLAGARVAGRRFRRS